MNKVYLGFPLDQKNNHIYIKKQGKIIQRCDTHTKAEEVVEITEEELERDIIPDDKYNLCGKCLQYSSGITV